MKFLSVLSIFVVFTSTQDVSGFYVVDQFNELDELRDQVQGLSEELTELAAQYDTVFVKKSKSVTDQMESSVDLAKIILKTQPPECTEGVDRQLDTLKQTSIHSFIKCTNLTNVISEVGAIILNTLKLTGDILPSVGDIVKLTISCHTWNPFTFIKCWVHKIEAVRADVMKDIVEAKQYLKDCGVLVEKIKANVDWCSHPHISTLQKSINVALSNVNDCVKRK